MDKSNMRKVILNFPNQLKEGSLLAEKVKLKGKFNKIVICGMGGSSLAGDILKDWKKEIPVQINRDYDPPENLDKKSLIVCISYSGNTEETISCFEKVKNLNVVSITSGGKLEKLSKENNIPFVKIPSGIQPRSATGYIFSSLVKVLENSKVIKEIEEISYQEKEKEGKEIAEKIGNKIPLIYSSNRFKSIAKIWKIKFNENSKIPSFYNYFPELNHNEMVGFTDTEKSNIFHTIIIRDEKDSEKVLKRMNLFSQILKKKNLEVSFVNIEKGNFLSKIFSSLTLGDWASYYLALKNNQDPTPVEIIENFKKGL